MTESSTQSPAAPAPRKPRWFVHKARELRATRRYLIAAAAWELREADRVESLPRTAFTERGIANHRARAAALHAALRALPYMPSRPGNDDQDDPTPHEALADYLQEIPLL